MEEAATETQKKRKERSDKGMRRGSRKAAPVAVPMFTPAPEPEAPIHVIVHLRNGMSSEFGCARRTVENGFHVFFYPSEMDRYRETRREFAISEIVEIKITEARQSAPMPAWMTEPIPVGPAPVGNTSGPRIHNARANALSALENSKGPIKMDTMPNLSFGNHDG